MLSYSEQGNLYHAVVVMLSLAFAGSVMLLARDDVAFFDKEWMKNGFCVADENTNYWTSHDTSFYADVFFSIIHLCLWLSWRNKPQCQGKLSSRVPQIVFGVLAHGLGHAGIAHQLRTMDPDGIGEIDPTLKPTRYINIIRLGILFWTPLLYSILYENLKLWRITTMGLVFSGFSTLLPLTYQFTFVQTVLIMCFAINELLRPTSEKDREYAMFPLIVGMPTVICGWIEALGCSAFYKSIGGHVWYDGTIAVTQIMFYIYCYLYGQKTEKPKLL